MFSRTRRGGFSVVELVIFLAALFVLVAIAAPRLVRSIGHDREPAALEVLDSLPSAVAPGSTEAIAVRVVDRRGEPVRGRRLEVLSSTAADSVAPARPHTDTAGIARLTWRAAAEQGSRTLRVAVPGTAIEARLSTVVGAPGDAPPMTSEDSSPQ